MIDETDNLDLGGWRGDDLAATLANHLGDGADASFDPSVRLMSAVARNALARMDINEATEDPRTLGVFLLQPTVPETAGAAELAPILDSGREQLSGRVWFTAEVARSGRYIDVSAATDAEIVSTVRDVLGCGSVPAVVLDTTPSPPQLRFYPEGLDALDSVHVWPVDPNEDVTVEKVMRVVDDIHRTTFHTPDMQTRANRLWADEGRRLPMQDAEDRIQHDLATVLKVTFPTCDVRHEQPGPFGRSDIQIDRRVRDSPGLVFIFAILELKVLRSRTSSNRSVSAALTRWWIKRGVKQAASYRDERGSRECALFCFDMRHPSDGDACFTEVLELANERSVVLRRWPVLSSSGEAREQLIN